MYEGPLIITIASCLSNVGRKLCEEWEKTLNSADRWSLFCLSMTANMLVSCVRTEAKGFVSPTRQKNVTVTSIVNDI